MSSKFRPRQHWGGGGINGTITPFGGLWCFSDPWVVAALPLCHGSSGSLYQTIKNNIKIKKVKQHNLTVGSQVEIWKLFCVAFAARKVKKTRCKHTRSNLRNQFRYRVLCLKGHQGDRLSGLQSQPMTARLVRNYFHGFCDMRSYHNINGVFSNVLSGGAHGAHVTKRKQLNRQNESNSEESLAASLQNLFAEMGQWKAH